MKKSELRQLIREELINEEYNPNVVSKNRDVQNILKSLLNLIKDIKSENQAAFPDFNSLDISSDGDNLGMLLVPVFNEILKKIKDKKTFKKHIINSY